MYVVFLYGPPAVGKLTIGRELHAATGLRLFHNHLGYDLAASLFGFGTPAFVELRERVWLAAFELAVREDQSFIFTFAPEPTVTLGFTAACERIVASRGGRIVYVALTAPEETIESRLDCPSRHQFAKLTSVENYRRYRDSGGFDFPMPQPALTLRTDRLSAKQAAREVQLFLRADEASRS